MKWFSLLFISLLSFNPSLPDESSSNGWKLKKVTEGIQVFTRDVAGSNLKELKIEMDFESTKLSTLVAVFNDSEAYTEWLYKCTGAKLIEKTSLFKTREYYQLDFPWPMTDRDLYTTSSLHQDPTTKILRIETLAIPDQYAEEEGIIRIKEHRNNWTLTPLENGIIRVVYTASSKPGGSIPDWMVNLAIDRGPTMTMKSLRKMILKEKYTSQHFPWLLD